MSGTYSQIYIHIIFAVKGRDNLISKQWCNDLFSYISGIITNKNQKSIIVNGMRDHIHILIGLKPSISISDLVRDIKNNSANFINENHFVKGHFSWQEGYGAFSCSHSHLKRVFDYIKTQEEHHKQNSFQQEYSSLLKKYEIQYNDDYLFEWID